MLVLLLPALLLIALGSRSSRVDAQSLAEVAKKEKERRAKLEQERTNAKVITEEDLEAGGRQAAGERRGRRGGDDASGIDRADERTVTPSEPGAKQGDGHGHGAYDDHQGCHE